MAIEDIRNPAGGPRRPYLNSASGKVFHGNFLARGGEMLETLRNSPPRLRDL
jgi:hypothetical protein